jgi:type I restriction enzyme S subunit
MHNINSAGDLLLDQIDLYVDYESNPDEYRVFQGDFLINRTNSKELVGKCCIVPKEFPYQGKLAFGHHIIRVFLDEERVYPPFVREYLNHPLTRLNTIEPNIHGATGLHQIHVEDIASWEIPALDKDDQEEIMRTLSGKLEAVNRIIAAAKTQLDTINALPSAYLREVFGMVDADDLEDEEE